MSEPRLHWPATAGISLAAALTTWVTLFSWGGLVELPSGYLVPSLGVCLLVALTGSLLRSARVPAVLVLLAECVVVLLWAIHAWAPEPALGGWLPTGEALREIGLRINDGALAAQQFAAPVPESAVAIHALFVAGAAGTVVLVDFLACGLRRVPLAGLPLLAVYTVPVSILEGGVPWWVFVLGALGFLATLAIDEAHRLAHWGRQISGTSRFFDSTQTSVSTQAVRSAAQKIGVTATAAAVIVPIFVPTLTVSLFDGNGNGPGGDGDTVAIANPMVDLRRDLVRGEDVPLLSVTTTDPDPSYLRISVLDEFDGQTWKPSGRDIPVTQRAEGKIPRPSGLESDVARTEVEYTIEVGSDFRSSWLPAPYPTSFLDAPGDWRYDTSTLDFVSAAEDQTTENLSYQLRALELRPTARQLADAATVDDQIYEDYTELPSSTPGSVLRLAQRVTSGASSEFAEAVALQDFFRRDGGFTYSTERSAGNGLDDLETFLGTGPDSRVGYCEQFAAAMAVMGRAIGIPSRVAVGFLRPDKIGNRTWLFSAHDLHAWPEMYFEGVGWVRFEPTPQDRATSVPPYTRAGLPGEDPAREPLVNAPSQQLNRFNRPDQQTPPRTLDVADPAAGSTGGRGGWLVALLVVAVLAVTPRTVRAAVRRRRWSAADSPAEVAEAAWAELRASAVDLGLPWDDSVTLRTRARSLVQSFAAPDDARHDDAAPARRRLTGPDAAPEATAALERLVRFVEQARYARSVPAAEAVAEDVERCVAALRAGASRGRRLHATWLPLSLLRQWRAEASGRSRSRRDRSSLPPQPGVDHAV